MRIDARLIHDLFPVIIFLIIFPAALIISYLNLKKQKGKMRETAARLGLEFSESDPLVAIIRERSQRAVYTGPRGNNAGFDFQTVIRNIARTFAPWQVGGKYNGYQVVIRTEKRDKKSYTVVQLSFAKPLGLGLNIVVGNFLSKVGKNLFGKTSITTGNPEMDDKIYISGKDEMRVKYLAKRPDTQNALINLYKKYPGARIDDNGIIYKKSGFAGDFMELQTILNSMAVLAKAMGEPQS